MTDQAVHVVRGRNSRVYGPRSRCQATVFKRGRRLQPRVDYTGDVSRQLGTSTDHQPAFELSYFFSVLGYAPPNFNLAEQLQPIYEQQPPPPGNNPLDWMVTLSIAFGLSPVSDVQQWEGMGLSNSAGTVPALPFSTMG